MLLIGMSMDLWKITCIYSISSIDKLQYPCFSTLSFLLYLPISSHVSQIINELCSSSSYSFHFRNQWHHEGGNFFLEYEQSNWLFYVRYHLKIQICKYSTGSETRPVASFDNFSKILFLKLRYETDKIESYYILCNESQLAYQTAIIRMDDNLSFQIITLSKTTKSFHKGVE